MTLQGQLAQSAHSSETHSGLFGDLLLSTGTNAGLLGNASAQVVRFSSSDVSSVLETYRRILSGAQSWVGLTTLKRRKFTSEGRQERIEASLAALNAPQPTKLSISQWKAILEEIEDED